MAYIIIDIISGCKPTTYQIDTDIERKLAKLALSDAGLSREFIWTEEPNSPSSYKTKETFWVNGIIMKNDVIGIKAN